MSGATALCNKFLGLRVDLWFWSSFQLWSVFLEKRTRPATISNAFGSRWNSISVIATWNATFSFERGGGCQMPRPVEKRSPNHQCLLIAAS
eukprot:1210346-Amphidinium_carterae.1